MHKKVIRGTVYYYTSVRENGRVRTIYLGRDKGGAREKETGLKNNWKLRLLNFINKRFFAFVFLAILIAVGLFFFREIIVGYTTFGSPVVFSFRRKINGNSQHNLGRILPGRFHGILDTGAGIKSC